MFEAIEKLTEPSYAIDLEIMKFMGFADPKDTLDGNRYKIRNSHHSGLITPYTSSIDTGLKLIPNGWGMTCLEKVGNQWVCELSFGGKQHSEQQITEQSEITSIAIIKAVFKLKKYLS